MELNAKIASLEDEVKLLKGEVKLILSEIRTAILGQDNPFAEPGQALRADPGALESRPPIRVVRVPSDDEERETTGEPPEATQEVIWPEETETPSAEAPRFEEPTPPPSPIMTQEAPAPPPARRPEPAPSPTPASAALPAPTPIASPAPAASTAADSTPRWTLITIAGLAVWAEEAVKQIGSERLRILLDLCEFTGYLSSSAKEALLKVTSLGLATEERTTAPSVNECLVVLCQLDALMRGEEPAGRSFQSLADKWQQSA
jgi:hypothetical protein